MAFQAASAERTYDQAGVRRTRLSFAALCAYVLAQAVYLPVIPIGGQWAIWPTPPDLAVALIGVAYLAERRWLREISRPNHEVFSALLLIVVGSFLSLIVGSLVRPAAESEAGRSIGYAVYQIYRTLQFVLVFRLTSGICMTPQRVKVLAGLVDAVIVALFVGVLATYTSVLDTRLLVEHLPHEPQEAAGPWVAHRREQLYGVGLVGWDHAYLALQFVMMTALRLSLRSGRESFFDSMILLMCAGGTFLTGSRSGLAAIVVFMVAYLMRRPAKLLGIAFISILLFLAAGSAIRNWMPDLQQTMQRQLALSNPLEGDNLSGRQEIWAEALGAMESDPIRWVVGGGLGSGTVGSRTSHMLYLHVIMETGVIGLLIAAFVLFTILRSLLRFEAKPRPILIATFAFLLTGMSQETFYPVSYLGHFTGLYLCCVALVLRVGSDVQGGSGKASGKMRVVQRA